MTREAAGTPVTVPPTRVELIQAIGKELSRLGLYQGPVPKGWTKKVRAAARRFSGTKAPKPTQALLAALQAAKRDEKSADTRPSLNMQTVAVTGATVAGDHPDESRDAKLPVQADGYLPPWARPRVGGDRVPGRSAVSHRAQKSKQPARTNAAKAKRSAAPRISKRQPKAKSMFANTSFAWPGL
ncbi:hypothetical protein KKP04_08745 [Rhodomicrobium sp. Az07]|uniref:hypothetical protein n=1 Tax=Rhodomicrobium sp. Az07 TaxID=2839034 RepID=UPI001BEAEF85|nr:hypothetical protein [Rhodomicrobium sp. Az07]MBT3070954.1 hypothetical protein [Rhodomicrobium sp. Az07]